MKTGRGREDTTEVKREAVRPCKERGSPWSGGGPRVNRERPMCWSKGSQGKRKWTQEVTGQVVRGSIALVRALLFTPSKMGSFEGLGTKTGQDLPLAFRASSPSPLVSLSPLPHPAHRRPRRSCRMASYGATRSATGRTALAAVGSTASWR